MSDKFDMNVRTRPEAIIQKALVEFLMIRSWFVKSTHGSMFQSGFPDLYTCHYKYGPRWIECKNPKAYAFTPAQLETFPLMSGHGAKIWILTAATEEEYRKLWLPPNWHEFLPQFKVKSRKIFKSHEYTPKYPCPGLKERK